MQLFVTRRQDPAGFFDEFSRRDEAATFRGIVVLGLKKGLRTKGNSNFDALAASQGGGLFLDDSIYRTRVESFEYAHPLATSRARALLLPRHSDLIDCPLLVRQWLGAPYSQSVTEITVDTPLPGINPPVVLAELLQKGFCALDVSGVVQQFEGTSPPDTVD